MPCLQYRYEGEWVIIHMNIMAEKVSLDHMIFSSLRWQQHIARCLSLFIRLIYDLILWPIWQEPIAYRITHIEQIDEKI